jgi:hypothetical protein
MDQALHFVAGLPRWIHEKTRIPNRLTPAIPHCAQAVTPMLTGVKPGGCGRIR